MIATIEKGQTPGHAEGYDRPCFYFLYFRQQRKRTEWRIGQGSQAGWTGFSGGLDRVLRRIGQGSQDVLTVSKLPGGRHKRHTYEEIEEREEMDAKIPSTTVS